MCIAGTNVHNMVRVLPVTHFHFAFPCLNAKNTILNINPPSLVLFCSNRAAVIELESCAVAIPLKIMKFAIDAFEFAGHTGHMFC